MATAKQWVLMSEAEYLAGEPRSDVKHEFVDGQVFAMSGASANHNRLAGNVFGELRVHLKGKPCQPYTSDMRVKTGSRYFYPDVMVDCGHIGGDSTWTETPTVLVEVLSPSTRRHDKNLKRLAYQQIPTLEEYVLIEQDFVEVTVMRRREQWQPVCYYLGDVFALESLGLTLAVADVYERVQNADVEAWLAGQ